MAALDAVALARWRKWVSKEMESMAKTGVTYSPHARAAFDDNAACRFCGSVPQSLGLKGCAHCGRGPSHHPNGRGLPDWRTIGLTAPLPSGVLR
jgi:hypothetical protein